VEAPYNNVPPDGLDALAGDPVSVIAQQRGDRGADIVRKADAAKRTDATCHVGYESLSQFTREYARMFGAPPRRDVSAVLAAAS
jgi:AraC-like DNA-binding protein